MFIYGADGASTFVASKERLITHFGSLGLEDGAILTKSLRDLTTAEFHPPSEPVAPTLTAADENVGVTKIEEAEFALATIKYQSEFHEYNHQKKLHVQQVKKCAENTARAYNILYSHCSTAVKEAVKADDQFKEAQDNQDAVLLLKLIQNT